MTLHVGIDFGTSNSGVAVFDGRKVHLLPLDPDNVLPQVVKTVLYITRDYRHFIGQEAIQQYYKQNIGRLRRFVKKWVGEIDVYGADMHYVRDLYTYVDELKPGRLMQWLKTALRIEGYQGTRVFDRYYFTADLIAAYLSELKRRAEATLGEPIQAVTLGRPVIFSTDRERDRQAEETLRQAALQAGFDQVTFELEPIAAALAYAQTLARPENALVFDFGGGTLDLTMLRLGDPHNRTVYANGGIGVAGSDFDRAIIQQRLLTHFGKGVPALSPDIAELVQAVSDWSALPELSTPLAKGNLERAIQAGIAPARLKALQSLIFNDLAFTFYNAVESAKIDLSSRGATVIRLQEKDLDLWELYTRWQFEQDIREAQGRIEEVLLDTVARSGLEPEQVDSVITTGGSSSIPLFQEMLARLFNPERIHPVDLFSSVTAGLAIRAYQNSAYSP